MLLTIELPMMAAGEMVEEVQLFFCLEWFRRLLKDRWEVGTDGPEPTVESILADEGAGVSDTLSVQ
jgi:hypothetical protein